MNNTQFIANKIDRLPKGYVFTFSDFENEVTSKEAAVKALNRMVASGKIAKLSKGKFYKPEQSVFGELPPNFRQVVKDLLEKDGKPVGYLTGLVVYNELNLTTQVANIIQIGRNEVRPSFQRGKYAISFVRQKNKITKENISMLQLLDAVKDIKKIPDAGTGFLCQRFMAILDKLSEGEEKALVKLALKYPPSTRALLGAILEELDRKDNLLALKSSLNPLTVYRVPQAGEVLSNTSNWNIR